jgi:hypothetical protein
LAIEAKIAINKARTTLRKLTELGLTEQDEAKLWTATANGNILPLRKRSPINLMAARWDPAPSVCWPCWIGRLGGLLPFAVRLLNDRIGAPTAEIVR